MFQWLVEILKMSFAVFRRNPFEIASLFQISPAVYKFFLINIRTGIEQFPVLQFNDTTAANCNCGLMTFKIQIQIRHSSLTLTNYHFLGWAFLTRSRILQHHHRHHHCHHYHHPVQRPSRTLHQKMQPEKCTTYTTL